MENNDYLDIIKQVYVERIKEMEDKYERIIEDKDERIIELNNQINYLRKLVNARDDKLVQNYYHCDLSSGNNVAKNQTVTSETYRSKYDQSHSNIGGIVDKAESASKPTFHQHNHPLNNVNDDPEKP